MPERVTFYSDGIQLVGYIYRPDNVASEEKRSAILACHGFGGHQEVYLPDIAKHLAGQGYVAMTFDYRGFGESDGPKWRLIPLEQIWDIRNALTFLQQVPGVDPSNLGLHGISFGGANVVHAAAVDQRVKCTVSVVGVGNGENWLKSIRSTSEWKEFQRELAEDWEQQVQKGTSQMVDIPRLMPSPPEYEAEDNKIAEQFPSACTQLPLETGQAVIDFHPDEVAHKISPRAVMFIVAEKDVLVLPEVTREVYDRALEPKKWMALPNCGHYDVYYPPAFDTVMVEATQWFQQYIPATVN